MAGVYNICRHFEYEAKRGVERLSTMQRAMGGEEYMPAKSPCALVARAVAKQRGPARVSEGGFKDFSGLGYYDSLCLAGAGIAERVLGSKSESSNTEGPMATREAAAMSQNATDLVNARRSVREGPELHDCRDGRTADADRAGASQSRGTMADLEVSDVRLLPPITLMHGTLDVTVPWYESVDMAKTLRDAGANARLLLYDWVPHIAFPLAWTARDLGEARSFQRDVVRLLMDEVERDIE
jgi:hypothetical protein